jgi:hypothetical protein
MEDGMLKRLALRILMVAGIVGAVVAASPGPAEAHGRSRVFFGLNVGVPCCTYGPRYYYPPPAYYYPPPVVYAPPPAYYAPAPVYAPTPAPAPAPVSTCRDYRGDATIDANGAPFYGRACLGGDGRWHIVSQY